jgi:uncharacterized membrane protein YeaQ/YmgE (transglycosylase-associated protein family)
MTALNLLILLVIAAVCGSIAQALVGYSRGGLITAIALGFIGALLGPWIAESLGMPSGFALSVGGRSFPVLWSIIGAAVFVAVISLVSRRRRYA